MGVMCCLLGLAHCRHGVTDVISKRVTYAYIITLHCHFSKSLNGCCDVCFVPVDHDHNVILLHETFSYIASCVEMANENCCSCIVPI
jgi:hypothetical protein